MIEYVKNFLMNLILYFRPESTLRQEKLLGVQEIAKKSHFHVQVIDEMPTPERVRKLLAFWNCSGVIVEDGNRKTQSVRPKDFGKTPVVFFNSNLSMLPKTALTIRHDSVETGTLAARELLLANTESFAFVPAVGDPMWSQDRERGFAETLALNGKRYRRFKWRPAYETTERVHQLQEFLRELPRPCALFAATDVLASEVISAAQLSGFNIPNDISVLGVDNDTNLCEHTAPPLSSIQPDFFNGGSLAMLMLLEAIRSGGAVHGPRHRHYGDLRIVHRSSTLRNRYLHPDPTIAKALELIQRKACSGLKPSDVIKLFSCSRRMAEMRFRREVGCSMLEKIHAVRLERAKEMLKNPNQDLTAISDFCGFKHPNSMRKFFLKATGYTLSAWRNR